MSQIARNKNHALAWRLHPSLWEKSHNGENAKMTSGMSWVALERPEFRGMAKTRLFTCILLIDFCKQVLLAY